MSKPFYDADLLLNNLSQRVASAAITFADDAGLDKRDVVYDLARKIIDVIEEYRKEL